MNVNPLVVLALRRDQLVAIHVVRVATRATA